jgi:predicted nucleotidyltransferase
MNIHRLKNLALAAAVSAGALTGVAQTHASSVDAVLQVGQNKVDAAQASQKKIDALASETGDLLQDYRTVLKQIDGLKVYNQRLERQIANQTKRMNDFERSIEEASIIQRQITPLIIRMIDGLEQFVALDVPFHTEERKQRIELLRRNLDRSDVSVAEKFRQVLEAYKIESEYGRTVDAGNGSIEIDGADREVSFFRVGRIALMYQTTDGKHTGMWDQKSRQWVGLSAGDYRAAVASGLRIARKQASIDVLKVPVPAPEAAK